MRLEQQIAVLSDLGLSLNQGVTIDDLLYSFPRKAYEKDPFELILFMLGAEVEREPWGRFVCARAYNLDMECINQTGDYVHIFTQLARVADATHRITHPQDFIDFETNQAWLKYVIDGRQRHWNIELCNDWADPMVIGYVMEDIEQNGCRFYAKDNSQASIWFYLDEATATTLNQLTDNALVTNQPS
ncbi:MAG: hypothetical protein AAGN15_07615 [Cyanobacteria bacterium J06581_3]